MTDWRGGGGGYGGPNPIGPGQPGQPGPVPSGAPGSGQGQWQQPPPWQPGQAAGTPPAAPYGPPLSFGGGAGPFGPPPPQRNRKALFVTLGAGAAVLVVIVIVLIITMTGNNGPGSGSAGDAVKGYLEALSRGDAAGALAYSDDQPASKDFLTDDILKKQIAKWPITNVRILNDDSSSSSLGMGSVHVAANFGEKVSDATLQLKRSNGRWRLDSATLKLRPSPGNTTNAADKTLTVFGKPVGDGNLYLFPGYIDVASSDPYLGVKAPPLLLDSLTSYTPWIQAEFTLNDGGTKAVNDALTAAFAACQKSNLLKPPDPCPMRGLDASDFVEGTAKWGKADLSQVKTQNFDQYRLQVLFFGQVSVPVTVTSSRGSVRDGTTDMFLNGSADISKVPPALSFR